TYFRSNHSFGQLPQAVLAGHVNGTSTTINLGTGLYTYLFAKYDGPNYGSEVWYVGDLSGIITIPATAGGYGLSGWQLFGPGVTVRIRTSPLRQHLWKASKHRNASVLVGKFTAETEAQEFAHRFPYLGRNLL